MSNKPNFNFFQGRDLFKSRCYQLRFKIIIIPLPLATTLLNLAPLLHLKNHYILPQNLLQVQILLTIIWDLFPLQLFKVEYQL